MNELRQRVVDEAKSWVGTPYHHMADVKGVGVDCAMLLVRVYVSAEVVASIDPRPYAAQWFIHRDEEKYLGWIKERSRQINEAEALPGDIRVYKFGRCAAHGAILIENDLMIHAYLPAGRVEIIERRATLVRGVVHSHWSPFL